MALLLGRFRVTMTWAEILRHTFVDAIFNTETYGALGAAMVLLLWFYLFGFVLLLGAVMNADIEHAAPIGKQPGEKVPGQTRKLGRAGMARWTARQREHHELPPSADDIRKATQ